MPKGRPVLSRLTKEDGFSTDDKDVSGFKVNLEATVELSLTVDIKENFNVWAKSLLQSFYLRSNSRYVSKVKV